MTPRPRPFLGVREERSAADYPPARPVHSFTIGGDGCSPWHPAFSRGLPSRSDETSGGST